LINIDNTILIKIIDVMGIKITPFSDSERISPGSFPNHENSEGKKCNAAPTMSITSPIIINHLAMLTVYENFPVLISFYFPGIPANC